MNAEKPGNPILSSGVVTPANPQGGLTYFHHKRDTKYSKQLRLMFFSLLY